MDNDTKQLTIVALALVLVIGSIIWGLYFYNIAQVEAIKDMVAHGANPNAAACAVDNNSVSCYKN